MTRAKFETEKILERTGQTLSPFAGGHARERSVVEKDGTGRWFVHFCQQFDERRFSCAILADNGDHCACRKLYRHIVQHYALRSGIGERNMLDSNALSQRAGNWLVAGCRDCGGVILKPRQPPRAVPPESSQESELAHGCTDVRRKPRARGQHQEHLTRRCVKP